MWNHTVFVMIHHSDKVGDSYFLVLNGIEIFFSLLLYNIPQSMHYFPALLSRNYRYHNLIKDPTLGKHTRVHCTDDLAENFVSVFLSVQTF